MNEKRRMLDEGAEFSSRENVHACRYFSFASFLGLISTNQTSTSSEMYEHLI